jgi:hypothetical protein
VQERHRCVLCFHALLVTEATLCAGSQCGCLCVDDVSSATNVTGALTKPFECTQMGAAGLDKLHGPRATWRCPCQFGCVYPTGAERRVLERRGVEAESGCVVPRHRQDHDRQERRKLSVCRHLGCPPRCCSATSTAAAAAAASTTIIMLAIAAV